MLSPQSSEGAASSLLATNAWSVPLTFRDGALTCCSAWFALLFGLGLVVGINARASAQDLLATATSDSPRKSDLNGVVLNSATGEGIAHALVTLNDSYGSARYVFTSLDGQFRFQDVPEGRATLVAQKPGFLEPPDLSRYSERRKQVKVVPKLSATTLRLIPEGVIFGTALRVDDEPLGGEVLLHHLDVVNGRRRLNLAQKTNTDDNGEFRFADLLPGSYSLTFEPYGTIADTNADEHIGYRTSYYPDVTDERSPKLIEIHPAEKREINFKLASEPAYHISGVVDGAVWGSDLRLELTHPDGDSTSASFHYGPGGYFAASDIPAGSYVLETQPFYRFEAPIAFLPISVGGNIENIHTALEPMLSIPVIVERRHLRKVPTPPHCYNFVDGLVGSSVTVHLVSHAGPERDGFSSWEHRGENQGPVVLARPGRYAVDIKPDDECSWFVESATYGSTDLMREDLVIPNRPGAQPIQVVLQDDIGKLTVNLLSDADEPPVAFMLIPEGTTPTAPQVQWGGPQANVTWESVAPGTYSLYAFDEIDDLDYTSPEVLSEYSAKAIRFEMHPDEAKTVALEVIIRGDR
jgi:hypothetical protein